MKRSIKTIVALVAVAVLMLSMVSCSGSNSTGSNSSKEPVKLSIWINGRDSFIGPDEQKKPQEEWYISKAIKRFEAQNPGVTVELTVPPDAAEAHQTFKAAGMAGNAPDIANLWSGQFIFALKDVIMPINKYISKEDKDNIMGWETTTLDFKEGGDVLGYPTPDNQMTFFLYNKKIIKDCGLDFDSNPPRTKADFDAAMQKIKAKGYIPVVADEGAGYPYYYFYVGAYWWVQETGMKKIIDEYNGAAKFADDKGLINSLTYYNDIYKNGFMNQDTATSGDSWNVFLQGKAAMYPSVSSVINDAANALGADNIGAIRPPDLSPNATIKDSLIGGPGQCLVVSKNCKNPEMAVKFMSFLNSKQEVLELYKTQTKVPIRKDISVAELGLKPGSVGSKLLDWSKNYVFWVDNSLTAPVVEDFNKLAPLVLVGKMTPQELAEQLDKDKGKK